MTDNNKYIRLRLKAFDHRLLDKAARDIAGAALKASAIVKGPFPLPTRINRWTVLRGPHVDKKSREQFERRTHSRLIDIYVLPENQAELNESLSKIHLPAGVDVALSEKQVRK
ncbi:MAG: 30S ribosomal protein S10 [Myxococcota bacterium]